MAIGMKTTVLNATDQRMRSVRTAKISPIDVTRAGTTAIRNNALWLAVVPALVTAIGLIFAVLTERVRWSVAFKIVVFMPMAISLFAAGVIWHLMDQRDPSQGP
jgi:ABC-type sugar transport system permease subunit